MWAGFSLGVSKVGTALQVTYSIHLGTEPISMSMSQVDGVAPLSPCPCHSLQLAIEGKLGSSLGFLVSPIQGFKNKLKCNHEGSFLSIKRKSVRHRSTKSQQLPGKGWWRREGKSHALKLAQSDTDEEAAPWWRGEL